MNTETQIVLSKAHIFDLDEKKAELEAQIEQIEQRKVAVKKAIVELNAKHLKEQEQSKLVKDADRPKVENQTTAEAS
jgi:hypothetical protein